MDATERFSNRAASYHSFRPRYPAGIIPFLEQAVGLTSSSVIADIGSGTGILTEMLLRCGSTVHAVEPNDDMRAVAESLLGGLPNFRSVNATAEEPCLPISSMDIITAAQAFHWFAVTKTRDAFSRTLKRGGWVVLIWNNRKFEGAPFLAAYERLLRTHGVGYPVVEDDTLPGRVREFFGPADFRRQEFANFQTLDLDGLMGRLLSASYVPNAGEAAKELLRAAEDLFRRHNSHGVVELEYVTDVYYGTLE